MYMNMYSVLFNLLKCFRSSIYYSLDIGVCQPLLLDVKSSYFCNEMKRLWRCSVLLVSNTFECSFPGNSNWECVWTLCWYRLVWPGAEVPEHRLGVHAPLPADVRGHSRQTGPALLLWEAWPVVQWDTRGHHRHAYLCASRSHLSDAVYPACDQKEYGWYLW